MHTRKPLRAAADEQPKYPARGMTLSQLPALFAPPPVAHFDSVLSGLRLTALRIPVDCGMPTRLTVGIVTRAHRGFREAAPGVALFAYSLDRSPLLTLVRVVRGSVHGLPGALRRLYGLLVVGWFRSRWGASPCSV